MTLLRPVRPSDIAVFFAHLADPVGRRMAAFTPGDPSDRAAHDAHWAKIFADARVTKRTICYGEAVVGHVVSFRRGEDLEVTYWIDRAHWGRGIATGALRRFLSIMTDRPLHARVAQDNVGSRRVLEKCGFAPSGEDEYFANARGEVVKEHIFVLAGGA